MDTRKIAKEYRLGHWSEIIRNQKSSGQSIKAYCEERDICLNVYHYWKRKLRIAACEQLEAVQRESAGTKMTAPGFAEVRVVSSSEPPELVNIVPADQLQIEVGGVRLSADAGYPADKLAELLRELVKPC